MAVIPEEVPQIRNVQIPAVLGDFHKRTGFIRQQFLASAKTIPCSASVVQLRRGKISQIGISTAEGDAIFSRGQTHNLFETTPTVLQAKDYEMRGDLLMPNGRVSWAKHPLLTTLAGQTLSDATRRSWDSSFHFNEEKRNGSGKIIKPGFRPPQLGALHAIAAHWSVSQKPALVVMPTGTGKTEVMLACMAMQRPERLLVLVPSDALRTQTFNKFVQFGILRKLGVLSDTALNPVTGMLSRGPRSTNELEDIKPCNVTVSTVAALQNMQKALLKNFLSLFDTVFFDEAHHVPAISWERIFEALQTHSILQFTATPFRLDGLRIPGRIIYNFPLRLAQDQGYFRKIRFLEVFEPDNARADVSIARKAVGQLRADISAGFDHFLLARADTIERAEGLLNSIYAAEFANLNPVLIHSRSHNYQGLLESIKAGNHKIIVCVDMFGEGFDFPRLKIAALHDPHRSLAITLQFTGRFTRDATGIGDATLVANTADPKVSESIEELYAEDSDWNQLIPELSAKAVQSQLDFSDFLQNMETAEISDDEIFGLNVLRPKTSTVIFKVNSFSPRSFRKGVKKGHRVERVWQSKDKDLLIFITRTRPPIEWANIKETSNEMWDLYIIAYQQARGLLFIHSSQTGTLHQELADAVSAKSAQLIDGEQMFRAFHGFSRLIFHNAGLYGRGKKLRFRMFTGLDVAEAINPAAQIGSVKSNLFAVGYENGERVSVGVSHKGRVWSMQSSSVPDWRQWCEHVAGKILDDNIGANAFLEHTLIPKEIAIIPNDKRIFSASLPVEWYSTDMEGATLFQSDSQRNYFSLGIDNCEKIASNHVDLTLSLAGSVFIFEMKWGPAVGDFAVTQRSGDVLSIGHRTLRSRLAEYFQDHPPVLHFFDGSEVIGPKLLEAPTTLPFTFDVSTIIVGDWTGIDITLESKWKNQQARPNSVQAKLISTLLPKQNQFVLDDDDSGEAADMDHIDEIIVIIPIASVVKRCPCCAARGVLTQAQGQSKFGARCNGCPLTFPEVYNTRESAITAWSLRRGSVSAAGGRATKGKSSWRKRRSCRKNLRLARKRKKLKWMRDRVDTIITWLKPHREVEMAEMRAALAKSWAELAVLEPLIRQYPDLSELLDWLKSRHSQTHES